MFTAHMSNMGKNCKSDITQYVNKYDTKICLPLVQMCRKLREEEYQGPEVQSQPGNAVSKQPPDLKEFIVRNIEILSA